MDTQTSSFIVFMNTLIINFIKRNQKALVMILAVLGIFISLVPIIGIAWCALILIGALVAKSKTACIISAIGLIISLIATTVCFSVLLPDAQKKAEAVSQTTDYKKLGLALQMFLGDYPMPSEPGFSGLNHLAGDENYGFSPVLYRVDKGQEKAQAESDVKLAYLGNGLSPELQKSQKLDIPVFIEKPWLSTERCNIIYLTGWVETFRHVPAKTCAEVIDKLSQRNDPKLPPEVWQLLRRNAAEIDRISGKSR